MSNAIIDPLAEGARNRALEALDWLDAPPDATLDQLVELAAWTFNVPVVTLSLLGPRSVTHKAQLGLNAAALAVAQPLGGNQVVGRGFLVVGDASQHTELAAHPWVTGEPGVRFLASVALTTAEGYNVGALSIMDTRVRELSDHEARILTALARLAMDHMALRTTMRKTMALHEELQQAHGWLMDSVSQDALTQVANRRALVAFLDKSLALARREQRPLSVLLVDVKQFRDINQQFGDAMGDRVLREVAARLAACARGSELVGRMAGDEFMAVLYPCTAEQAALAAERYVSAVAERTVPLGAVGGFEVQLTLAHGVFTTQPGEAVTADELYRQVALALDHHKTVLTDQLTSR